MADIIFVMSKGIVIFEKDLIKQITMNIGDKIPELLGTDATGKVLKASEFIGKKLVIYFYPKDNTPGCTAEACSIRDGYAELIKAGYSIIGVSKDSSASHAKFAEKYNLPFPLIADTDLSLNNAFGVWQQKKMAGREYMGTVRTTFIIDEMGTVTDIITKVDTKESANQILNKI